RLTLDFMFLLCRRPPQSTRFPYTTLFRSGETTQFLDAAGADRGHTEHRAELLGDVGDRAFAVVMEQPLHGGRREEQRQAELLSRSEEHTSELQSRENLVCRLLLEKKKKNT